MNEEIGALRDNLTATRHEAEEIETLRAERDQVRERVAEMLEQLEALDL